MNILYFFRVALALVVICGTGCASVLIPRHDIVTLSQVEKGEASYNVTLPTKRSWGLSLRSERSGPQPQLDRKVKDPLFVVVSVENLSANNIQLVSYDFLIRDEDPGEFPENQYFSLSEGDREVVFKGSLGKLMQFSSNIRVRGLDEDKDKFEIAIYFDFENERSFSQPLRIGFSDARLP